MLRRLARAACLLGLTLAISGCGAEDDFKRVSVQGSVLLDGKPLASGAVRLVPLPGVKGPVVQTNITNGAFHLDRLSGPAMGWHRVEVEGRDYWGFPLDDEDAFGRQMQQQTPLPPSPVPLRYCYESPLKAEIVAEGTPPLEIVLSSEPVGR